MADPSVSFLGIFLQPLTVLPENAPRFFQSFAFISESTFPYPLILLLRTCALAIFVPCLLRQHLSPEILSVPPRLAPPELTSDGL